MSDIFISYSRKDADQALMLTEMLVSAGLSVWIDKSGIEAATSWSGEIYDAIEGCKALVVMLSSSSITSKNVVREVALAFEKNKKILPLDIEPVPLTRDLGYHLAGLQRTSMSNIDAVIRALGKLGLEATSAPELKLVKEPSDGKKSLMILPFEDLSPSGDNAWFADGIANELISTLSNIKSLRVSDQQATKDYKRYTGALPVYAKEMRIRYFIQGDVRKFGDQIKISSALLDIETGDHLWQKSLKGTMENIFEIQEQVAASVVEGLNVVLAENEKQKLTERGTENAEAYELYIKAEEYNDRQSKEGFQLAIQLLTEAIALDPQYAAAYRAKAFALVATYHFFERNPNALIEAESLCFEALRLRPDLFAPYHPLALVYVARGNFAEAEQMAMTFVRHDPENFQSHFTLGLVYALIGRRLDSIRAFEECARLKPDRSSTLFNLVLTCNNADLTEQCAKWAALSQVLEKRYLKLHPNEDRARSCYAISLFFSGNAKEALIQAGLLENTKDSPALSNIAYLYANMGDKRKAAGLIARAIEGGDNNFRLLNEFLTEDRRGIVSLAGTPEYEAIRNMLQKAEAEAAAHA